MQPKIRHLASLDGCACTLKNEFTDEKYHDLVRWLIYCNYFRCPNFRVFTVIKWIVENKAKNFSYYKIIRKIFFSTDAFIDACGNCNAPADAVTSIEECFPE